jgi:hypothetical protein
LLQCRLQKRSLPKMPTQRALQCLHEQTAIVERVDYAACDLNVFDIDMSMVRSDDPTEKLGSFHGIAPIRFALHRNKFFDENA